VDVAGSKVTISHANDFAYDAPVTVAIGAGVFVDEAGNPAPGINDWTFRTAEPPAPDDNTAPTVAGLSPADDATGIAENAKLELTFSEEVVAATGNITITVNGTPQTVDVTTNAVKVNKEKVTIDAANFPEGATVSVAIPAGAFKDKAGNNFAGLAASAWNFTVKPAPGPVDSTPPTIAALSPANNANNVAATTSSLEITFDENINKLTGNITLTGTGFSQTIAVAGNAVKVAGKKATIELAQALPYATAISVALPAGTFEDETGNDFTGLAASAWTFTTVDAPTPTDNTAPIVSELSPKDDATEVAGNAKLEITFSEEVVAATGNITITVNGVAQTVDVTTNAVKVNKEKVTIDAAAFPEGATVSVAIPAGAFKDKAGNNFAGLAAGGWNFTVQPPADKTPPRVTARQPANNDNNIPVNARLVLDFDEKVKKGQGAIVLTQGSNTENIGVESEQVDVAGSKVTISHTNDFAYDSPVTVAIAAGVFVDENGNAFEGTNDWTFRTAEPPAPNDNTAPTVAGLSRPR
jgi:methionine-rich copper-binding protein CopC